MRLARGDVDPELLDRATERERDERMPRLVNRDEALRREDQERAIVGPFTHRGCGAASAECLRTVMYATAQLQASGVPSLDLVDVALASRGSDRDDSRSSIVSLLANDLHSARVLRSVKTTASFAIAVTALFVIGCAAGRSPADPVRAFDVSRYTGTWYEVARLPHRFERDLTDVTAEYSKNADGTIRVLNRGWSPAKDAWQTAEGRAKFTSAPDVGQLKVSFFGPFYGLYTIAELDPEYRWAMVVGPGTGYFWVLSRTPVLDEATLSRLIERAGALGIDTAKIERVSHTRAE